MKILTVSVLLVAMMVLALANEAVHIPDLEAAALLDVIETESDIEELDSTEGQAKCVVKRPVCPRGWFMIGKTCYQYFKKPGTWVEGQTHCKSLGANLASVHNKVENNRFWGLAQKKTVWIGFSDAQQLNHWFWIDGTALNYSNWCKGQPQTNKNEHCAVLWKGQNCWHDYHCTAHRFPYICARPAQ